MAESFVHVRVTGGEVIGNVTQFVADAATGTRLAAERDMEPRIRRETPVREGVLVRSLRTYQPDAFRVRIGYTAPYAPYVRRARNALIGANRRRARAVARAGIQYAVARARARQ